MRAVPELDEETQQLFAEAAVQTARGSRSFYSASRFFPRKMAQAAHAVYWFCRYTDDLVDECESVAQGKRDLDHWQDALTQAAHGHRPHHPVLKIFLHVVERFDIPLDLPFELIEGMRMDLNQTRYRTFDELRVFCYRVASVVGLMMCSVIGFRDGVRREDAWPHAIDLGIAMQLTNILRDIGEDLDRGRIYLPLEEMEAAGYTEDDLRARQQNQAYRRLMRQQAERAHKYYQFGNKGIAMLHRDGRFAVKLASDIYREILEVIQKSSYDVFSRRAVVSSGQKRWLIACNMASPFLRRIFVKSITKSD